MYGPSFARFALISRPRAPTILRTLSPSAMRWRSITGASKSSVIQKIILLAKSSARGYPRGGLEARLAMSMPSAVTGTAVRTPPKATRLQLSGTHDGTQRIPSIQRLLIVRLSAMGDVIHTLSAVYALSEAFPDEMFGWLL